MLDLWKLNERSGSAVIAIRIFTHGFLCSFATSSMYYKLLRAVYYRTRTNGKSYIHIHYYYLSFSWPNFDLFHFPPVQTLEITIPRTEGLKINRIKFIEFFSEF